MPFGTRFDTPALCRSAPTELTQSVLASVTAFGAFRPSINGIWLSWVDDRCDLARSCFPTEELLSLTAWAGLAEGLQHKCYKDLERKKRRLNKAVPEPPENKLILALKRKC